MTNDAFIILQYIFGAIWRLFTSFYIPGTRVTPAGILFLVLFGTVVLRFVKRIFNLHKSTEED